ncbi:MAG: hypothetical protein ACE14V_12730 [bacterium]
MKQGAGLSSNTGFMTLSGYVFYHSEDTAAWFILGMILKVKLGFIPSKKSDWQPANLIPALSNFGFMIYDFGINSSIFNPQFYPQKPWRRWAAILNHKLTIGFV